MATLTGKKKTIEEMAEEINRGAKSSSSSVSGQKNASKQKVINNTSVKSVKDTNRDFSLIDAYMKNQKKQSLSVPSSSLTMPYSRDEMTVRSYESIPNYNVFQRMTDPKKKEAYDRKQSLVDAYTKAKNRQTESFLKKNNISDSMLENVFGATNGKGVGMGTSVTIPQTEQSKNDTAYISSLQGADMDALRKYYEQNLQGKATNSMKNYAEEHPLIGTIPTFSKNVGGILGSIEVAKNYLTGNPLSKSNSDYIAKVNDLNDVRAIASESIANKAPNDTLKGATKFMYDVGTSIGDMGMAYLLSPQHPEAVMATNAFLDSVINTSDRGLTPNKIMETSSTIGLIEGALSKIPFKNLKNIFSGGASKETGKSFIKNVLKQTASEAGEEMATEALDSAADYFINGELSNFVQRVEQYQNTGMSEDDAKKQAWKDLFGQIAYAGAAGAVSGGIMGGGASLINKIGGKSNIAQDVNENSTTNEMNLAKATGEANVITAPEVLSNDIDTAQKTGVSSGLPGSSNNSISNSSDNVNVSTENVNYNSKKIDGFAELNSALDRLVGMYKGNENTQSMYEQMKSAINEYLHTYNQDAIDRALNLAADIDNSLVGHSYTRKGSGKGSAKAQNNRVTTTFSEGEFVDTILAYGKELRNTARGNQTNQIQTNVVPIRNSYTDVTAKSGDKISQTRTNTIENSGMASSEELQKYHAPEQFTYESISEEESTKRATDKLNKYGQDYISDILYSENQSLSGSDIDALMMEYKRLSEIARKSGSDADWNNAQDILKKVQVASTRNAQALQALAKWSRNTPEGQLAYANTAIEQTIEKKFGQKRTQKARELVDSVYNAIKSGNTSRLGYELGKLNLGQDVISNSNEVNRNTVVDLLTKEGKIDSKLAEAIKEDTATQRKVLDMLDQMYDVGIDTYEGQVLMARAGKILAGKMQHTLGDKVRQVLYNNMLGNFRTLITRNAGGNFAVAAMEQARQPLSATIDRAVSKFTGKRTTTGWSVEKQLAYVKGYAKGLNADIKDIRKTLSEYKSGSNSGLHTSKSGENTLLNAIKNNDSAFKGNGIITKMMNFTNDMVKHGLSLGDRPFFEATKSQAEVEIKQLLKKGYDIDTDGLNLDEYIDQASTLIALEAVYQGDTELSKGFQQIRNGLAEMTKGMVGTDIMSTAVVPFVKTPSNVLDMTIEYSPFGLFKNIAKTFVETKNGEFNQRRFVDETSRNLMGTLLLAGCALAYSAGHLTGGYDKDKDVKAAQKAAGMQQYALSMNGGKTNMDIGWIPVIGSAAEAGAAYGDARKNGSGFVGATGKAIGQTAQSVFDQSMLESLSNFLGSNSFNDENFLTNATKNAVGSYIGMLAPSLGRQIAQSTDEYERNLGTYGTGEYYLNNLLNSIPGARQLLDVKYDNEGNKILQNQGRSTGSKLLENMLLPGKLTNVNYSDSSTEAMRLYDSTGEKTQFIPTADKKDITTDNYTPTTEEFNNYKRLLGENNSVGAAAFMDSDFYASIDDYDKVKYLSEIYSDMKVISKREVIPDYEIPKGSKKKMEIYDEFGIDGLVNYYYISKTSGGKDSGKINAISNLDMTDEDKGKYISMLIDISKDAETAYTWNGYEGVYSYYINNVAKNSSKVTDAEDIDALRQRIEAYANGNVSGSQNEMANRISAYVNGKKSGNTASQNTVLSIQNGTAQHGEDMQKMMNKIQAYIDSKNNQ